jgi:putative ABC transport system permease protein
MKRFFNAVIFSLRLAAKTPMNTVLCILVLAGGIALVTSMFSTARIILFSKVPYADSDRIAIFSKSDDRGNHHEDWKFNSYRMLLREQNIFTDVLPFFGYQSSIFQEGENLRVQACYTGCNLSKFTGINPIIGRSFDENDLRADSPRVVLIGERLWKNEYGGTEDVIGKTMTLNGIVRTIVGVMPMSFDGPVLLTGVQVWMPLDMDTLFAETGWGDYVSVLGKIRSGLSRQNASERGNDLVKKIVAEYPDENRTITQAKFRYINGELFDDSTRDIFKVLFACAILILFMACGIVSGLMTARYSTRTQELAIRSALGASRWQIVSQMVAEFSLISIGATLLGLLLDRWIAVSFLASYFENFHLPLFLLKGDTGANVIFVIIVLVAVTLLSTLLPALRASKADLASVLRESTRTGSSQRVTKLSNFLIIWQVATAGAVLSGGAMTGYMIYEFSASSHYYDPEKYVCAMISFNQRDHQDPKTKEDRINRIMNESERYPELEKFCMTNELFSDYKLHVWIEGESYPDEESVPTAAMRVVSPGYFSATNIPIISGREFEKTDNINRQRVTVVSDAFAKKFFGTTDVIGKRFKNYENNEYLTIIGVVPDIFQSDGSDKHPVGFCVPYCMAQWQDMFLFAKSHDSNERLGETLIKIVRDVDNKIGVSYVMPVSEYRKQFFGGLFINFLFSLFMAFAVGALVMASAGLFGIISFSVNMKRKDNGIKLALGAAPGHIVVTNAKIGLLNASIGIVLSFAGTILISHFLSRIFDTLSLSTGNWIIYVSSYSILCCVILVSILTPACRGALVEPITALRDE